MFSVELLLCKLYSKFDGEVEQIEMIYNPGAFVIAMIRSYRENTFYIALPGGCLFTIILFSKGA